MIGILKSEDAASVATSRCSVVGAEGLDGPAHSGAAAQPFFACDSNVDGAAPADTQDSRHTHSEPTKTEPLLPPPDSFYYFQDTAGEQSCIHTDAAVERSSD